MLDESMITISNLRQLCANHEVELLSPRRDTVRNSILQINSLDYERKIEVLMDRALTAEEELEVIKLF
jgi:hypothetical protein